MQRYLVATDLSESSDDVVKAAVDLARRLDGSVELIHVLTESRLADIRESLPADDSFTDSVVGLMRDSLTEQVDRLADGVEATFTVARGSLADEIISRARAGDADCIVLGLRSRSRVGKLITGSEVQEILLTSPCPVLGIPI